MATLVGIAVSPTANAADDFHVVLLGTGIPLANPARACAATLVVAGERTILVDTGRGSMVRLVGAGYQDVSQFLFTHFHSDHIADFGEIMVNRSIAGADTPLAVSGPKGTQRVVDELLAAYRADGEYRKEHHDANWPEDGMKADVTEHDPGVIYDEGGLKITMFDVDHWPVVPAVGYRFDYNGQSIVVSGDTKAVQQMVEMSKGCDILVHEVMNADLLNRLLTGLQQSNPRQAALIRDLMEHHTSTLEAAQIAKDAGVKKLVLTHFVPSIQPIDAAEAGFIRGMSDIYGGEIIVGRDGMKIVP